MGFLRQLRVLLWKNLILKARSLVFSIIEFIIPTIIVLILVWNNDIDDPGEYAYFTLTVLFSIPLCFVVASRYILGQVVFEKETKIKETLKIMSLRVSPYGLSFVLAQGLFNVVISFIVTMLYLFKEIIQGEQIMPFFFCTFFFSMALITFSLMVSTFFSDSKVSVQIGTLIIILPMALYMTFYQKHANLLPIFYWLPHFPLTVIIQLIALPGSIPELKIGWAWFALVLTIPFYFFLYVYLDAIIPDTYGINKRWNYCLKRKVHHEAGVEDELEGEAEDPIVIKKLSKNFGSFKAVDELSLSIRSNEVFSLLGHNGAGKTTTLYMLTGVLKPTSGDAHIYGNQLSSDLDDVRKSLGLCQQIDVLFDDLTVTEHLHIVCELKDLRKAQREQEIKDTLDLVMLTPHKDKRAKQLSGGMKRKLSLGMALIGGSKIIILDEPTSGLDVDSRRQVWDLIRQIKSSRSIIMSTQHLEEADELGDRICIMSHGKLLTLDTSFNIKKRFGVGYNLLMEGKNEKNGNNMSMKGEIDDIVLRQGLVVGAQESMDSSIKRLIYTIPFDQQHAIPALLSKLEDGFRDEIYIDIEMNSLEDAYVNIAKEELKLHQAKDSLEETTQEQPLLINQTVEQPDDFYLIFAAESSPSFFQQMLAVFVRRIRQFLREPRIWICLFAPFITAVVSFLIINNISATDDQLSQDTMVLVNGIMFSMWMLIGFALCAGLFIVGLTYDREKNLRYLMNFAGLQTIPYVLGMYLADFVLFLIPTLGFIIILFPMNIESFSGSEGYIFLLMICFGLAMISLTYLIGYSFKSSDKAFRMTGTAYAVIGFVVPIALIGFLSPVDNEAFKSAVNAIFYFDPFYPFYLSLMWICMGSVYGDDTLGIDFNALFPGFLPYLYRTCPALLGTAVVYLLLAIYIDYYQNAIFRRKDGRQTAGVRPLTLKPDEDVVKERQHLKGLQNMDEYNVVVENLEKCYPNGFQAVQDISFGIKKNQVIGLLGPNGAGKSTTFNILTMDIPASFGDINILNQKVEHFRTQDKGNGHRMGLCPQYNSIWDKLTVDEHLNFMGALKGLNRREILKQREYLKKELELSEFANRKAENLSGGNKRKLCCAISLLANPLIEFLDEPTSGVDPVARRSLFKILKKLRNSSIMLTTHRMDEAEALCDSIAIMINGSFVCYGSPGYLKSKYGQGYQITVHLPPTSVSEQELDAMITESLPWSKREEEVLGEIQVEGEDQQRGGNFKEIVYNIRNLNQMSQVVHSQGISTDADLEFKLSQVFAVLNRLVAQEIIADFSVTRSSLEHVFVHFAKYQRAGNASQIQVGSKSHEYSNNKV